ncbi:MAG: flagellar motor switch protein FliG, partial [Spirochaetes bacterium]|nr:flagellar motor switch protein FliG [Spirochaetota bacterium]
PEVATEVLKHLDEESVHRLVGEIAKIQKLTPEEKEDLIGEFIIELKKNRGVSYGGENVARDLIAAAFGEEKAKEIFDKLSQKDLEKGFEFLNEVDPELIVTFLADEHPQTVTVTLAHIQPKKAAEVLKRLDPRLATEVAKRMAKMDKTTPEAVVEIARVLRRKYDKYRAGPGFESTGGVDTLVKILNYMSGDQEKALMEYFEKNLPEIARDIRDRIYTFDHVLNLDNREMRILIDAIGDDKIIARALKGAGDAIRIKFFRNMSRNRATDILYDMDAMGPIRISEIHSARDMIVRVMRELDEQKIITIKKEKEEYIE